MNPLPPLNAGIRDDVGGYLILPNAVLHILYPEVSSSLDKALSPGLRTEL